MPTLFSAAHYSWVGLCVLPSKLCRPFPPPPVHVVVVVIVVVVIVVVVIIIIIVVVVIIDNSYNHSCKRLNKN